MSEERQSNLTNPDLWIRLVYMLVFWLLSWLARLAIAVVAAIQFVLVLVNGEGNSNLRRLGQAIAIWTQQNFLFLSFACEEKPFPFQDWPQYSEENGGDDENQSSDIASASASSDAVTTEATPPPSSQQPASQGGQGSNEDNGTKSSFGNIREP